MGKRSRQRGRSVLWRNCILCLPVNYSRAYVEKKGCCPDGGLVGMFPSGVAPSTPPNNT